MEEITCGENTDKDMWGQEGLRVPTLDLTPQRGCLLQDMPSMSRNTIPWPSHDLNPEHKAWVLRSPKPLGTPPVLGNRFPFSVLPQPLACTLLAFAMVANTS